MTDNNIYDKFDVRIYSIGIRIYLESEYNKNPFSIPYFRNSCHHRGIFSFKEENVMKENGEFGMCPIKNLFNK